MLARDRHTHVADSLSDVWYGCMILQQCLSAWSLATAQAGVLARETPASASQHPTAGDDLTVDECRAKVLLTRCLLRWAFANRSAREVLQYMDLRTIGQGHLGLSDSSHFARVCQQDIQALSSAMRALASWQFQCQVASSLKKAASALTVKSARYLQSNVLHGWQQASADAVWRNHVEASTNELTTRFLLRTAEMGDLLVKRGNIQLVVLRVFSVWQQLHKEALYKDAMTLSLRGVLSASRSDGKRLLGAALERRQEYMLVARLMTAWLRACHVACSARTACTVLALCKACRQADCVEPILRWTAVSPSRADEVATKTKRQSGFCRRSPEGSPEPHPRDRAMACRPSDRSPDSRVGSPVGSHSSAIGRDTLAMMLRHAHACVVLMRAFHAWSTVHHASEWGLAMEITIDQCNSRSDHLKRSSMILSVAFHHWSLMRIRMANAVLITRHRMSSSMALLLANLVSAWRLMCLALRWNSTLQSTSQGLEACLQEGQADMMNFARGSRIRLLLVRLLAAWLRACKDLMHAFQLGVRMGEIRTRLVLGTVLEAWRQDFSDMSRISTIRSMMCARLQANATLHHDATLTTIFHQLARRGHTRSSLLQILGLSQPWLHGAAAASHDIAQILMDCLSCSSLSAILSSWLFVASALRADRGDIRQYNAEVVGLLTYQHGLGLLSARIIGAWVVFVHLSVASQGLKEGRRRTFKHAVNARFSQDLVLLQQAWSALASEAFAARHERSCEHLRKNCEAGRCLALRLASLRARWLEHAVLTAWQQRHVLEGRQRSLLCAGAARELQHLDRECLKAALCVWSQLSLRCLAGRRLHAGALLHDALALWRWGVALERCSVFSDSTPTKALS